MSLELTIKGIIGKLNLEWFNAISTEFKSDPFYNKESGMIDDSIEDFQILEDYETGEIIEHTEIINFQANLSEYSWQKQTTPTITDSDNEFFFKAVELLPRIIEVIDPLISEATELTNKHQIVVATVQYMLEETDVLKNKIVNPEFDIVIDFCVSQLRVELSRMYGGIKKAHDTISEFEDKLLFDMNKKELAFLLAVLIKADIFHGPVQSKPVYKHFFSKYFYFKNQKNGNGFSRAFDIDKKISDVTSFNNTGYAEIKRDIKERLNKAIDNL